MPTPTEYNNVISLQNTLITNINNTITDLLSKLTIKNPTSTMAQSNFANINSQNSIEFTPKYNNTEINNYMNSYNNSIALLEDPNQMTKTAFDTYIHIQNNKINKLQTNLQNLQNNILTNNPPLIKGIKSLNNSKILNVEAYPNPSATNNGMPSSYSGNGARNYPNYLIYGNNGCLEYKPQLSSNPTPSSSSSSSSSSSPSPTSAPPSWAFKKCNSNNANQQFSINKINTLSQYNNLIKNPINSSYLLNNSSSTQYGFYTVNPSNGSEQCLQLNNDGISIMPCTLDSSQRFKSIYHPVIE